MKELKSITPENYRAALQVILDSAIDEAVYFDEHCCGGREPSRDYVEFLLPHEISTQIKRHYYYLDDSYHYGVLGVTKLDWSRWLQDSLKYEPKIPIRHRMAKLVHWIMGCDMHEIIGERVKAGTYPYPKTEEE